MPLGTKTAPETLGLEDESPFGVLFLFLPVIAEASRQVEPQIQSKVNSKNRFI